MGAGVAASPHCPSLDCRRRVAKLVFAGRSGGRLKQAPASPLGERSGEARSDPRGFRRGPKAPAVPVGSGRAEAPPVPPDPGRAEARPFSAESFGRSEPLPPLSRSVAGQAPFPAVRIGIGASPVPSPADGSGRRFSLSRRFAAPPPGGLEGTAERLHEIPPRIRFRLCGPGFLRRPPVPPEPEPFGLGPFGSGCPFGPRIPVSGRSRPSGHELKLSRNRHRSKRNPAVENEDNGGKTVSGASRSGSCRSSA